VQSRRIWVGLWTLGWLTGMVPAVCGASLGTCGYFKAEAASHACCPASTLDFRLNVLPVAPKGPSPVDHCHPPTPGNACLEVPSVSLTPSFGKVPNPSDSLSSAGTALGGPPVHAFASFASLLVRSPTSPIPLYRLACQLRC
jgi:hypothetical protein